MEFIATQKYVLTSPKKLREVSMLLKGLKPADAVDRLPFVGKRAADPLRKAIMTAIANARQKGVSDTILIFKEVQIMEGPKLKRFRAGARGRAKPYKRRMSHIKVVLQTQEPKETVTVNEKKVSNENRVEDNDISLSEPKPDKTRSNKK